MSGNTITEDEEKDFKDFIKKWAFKKMRKQEKKLRYYARLYFEEPVSIVYLKNGTKVIRKDGTEGEIRV